MLGEHVLWARPLVHSSVWVGEAGQATVTQLPEGLTFSFFSIECGQSLKQFREETLLRVLPRWGFRGTLEDSSPSVECGVGWGEVLTGRWACWPGRLLLLLSVYFAQSRRHSGHGFSLLSCPDPRRGVFWARELGPACRPARFPSLMLSDWEGLLS